MSEPTLDRPLLDRLTTCSCCGGREEATPASTFNRPGLSSLSYRVGTHGRFKASMLAALSTLPALKALTTRRDDDLGIALLDSWALVLDVLTFYQERIANEGYLRTALRRRSLLELARSIGYELRPGVAAGTHLAFTLDGSPGSPEEIVLTAGTRVQSIPGQNELPQPFETSHDLVARPEWSALAPRLHEEQLYDITTRRFLLQGTATRLAAGDKALLVISAEETALLTVLSVHPDAASDTTEILTEKVVAGPVPEPPQSGKSQLKPQLDAPKATLTTSSGKQQLTGALVKSAFSRYSWSQQDWTSYAKVEGWSKEQLSAHLNSPSRKPRPAPAQVAAAGEAVPGLYALRTRAGIFGHNAQLWDTTPIDWRVDRQNSTAPYPDSWEGLPITQGATGVDFPQGVIYLERSIPQILGDSWAILVDGAGEPRAFQVARSDEETVADFGLSSKASRLQLAAASTDLALFSRRGTTVLAQSEPLELAELPIEKDVAGETIDLDLVELRLEPGRLITVRGERSDLAGVVSAEIAEVEEILQVAGVTRLQLTSPLAHSYLRSTVSINANTAAATHGETSMETLGSGDAARAFQRFRLKQAPLTFTAAPVPSGGVSSLQLRVNGVLWHEADSFYGLGPDDRSYVLRRSEDGGTSVIFGDGERGARLPTGVENVRAVYRKGLGLGGQMAPDRITLLATRPLGVREVTNPVPADGAENAETQDQARTNAPLTVRTLDRIVSLNDFEDFAQAFSGIGKAAANRLWDGSRRVVYVTLAAADGGPVGDGVVKNLRQAMDAVRDTSQPLLLGSFDSLFFSVHARLKIDPDHLPEAVLEAAQQRLRESFSFESQEFAKRVPKSRVLAVLQRVTGVLAVDLEAFAYSPSPPSQFPIAVPPSHLESLPARRVIFDDGSAEILPAQLLTLAEGPALLEVLT